MSVTIHPDTNPVSNDMVLDRAEDIRICKLFNTEYNKGIESPRRAHLLQLLKQVTPLIKQITLEAKAVVEGERKRYVQAVDRMLEKEHINPIDSEVTSNIDPVTASIWGCCESLTWEIGRECPRCGTLLSATSCLDDDEAIIKELITRLDKSDNTKESAAENTE